MQRIGRYEILQHLASGGMGSVYLARASGVGGFERHVVIKTLEMNDAEDHPFVAMFLDEARLVGGLHHHHIAPVYEVGRTDDGRYFLVMDYVHGQTAAQVWEQTIDLGAALPIDFALTVTSAAASALHYAHSRKMKDGQPLALVHRDVTLSNLMIGYDGAIKLIDFGIAKAANRATETQTGYVKGKVGYMAPEQVLGKQIDQRTDIFTLGIVLYELTTMRRAFREPKDQATIDRIKKVDYVPPSQIVPGYPRGLELIVQKALKLNPDERFQDADHMRRELEALGHRQKLVLGDAAIVEVMNQLFENQAEPWLVPGKRAGSSLDIPVDATPEAIENDKATRPVQALREATDPDPEPMTIARKVVRNLRAATEMADQMVIEVHDDDVPEETVDPPTTRIPSDHDAKETAPRAAISESQKQPARPVPPLTASAKTALVNAQRGPSIVGWTVTATFIVAGIVGVLVTDVFGGSNAPAARANDPTPAPTPVIQPSIEKPKVATAPTKPPEPTKPAMIRIHITTTPADATVLLDGQKLGHTPYDATVPAEPGMHVIKLRRRGYGTLKLDVDLGKDVTRDIQLREGGSPTTESQPSSGGADISRRPAAGAS
jgi:serine/threonine protein kinase